MSQSGELGRLLEVLAERVLIGLGCGWFAATDLSGARPLVMLEAGTVPGRGWLPASAARAACGRGPGGRVAISARQKVLAAELPSAEVLVLAGSCSATLRSEHHFTLVALCRNADASWRQLALRSGMNAHPSGRSGLSTRPIAAS